MHSALLFLIVILVGIAAALMPPSCMRSPEQRAEYLRSFRPYDITDATMRELEVRQCDSYDADKGELPPLPRIWCRSTEQDPRSEFMTGMDCPSLQFAIDTAPDGNVVMFITGDITLSGITGDITFGGVSRKTAKSLYVCGSTPEARVRLSMTDLATLYEYGSTPEARVLFNMTDLATSNFLKFVNVDLIILPDPFADMTGIVLEAFDMDITLQHVRLHGGLHGLTMRSSRLEVFESTYAYNGVVSRMENFYQSCKYIQLGKGQFDLVADRCEPIPQTEGTRILGF